MYNEDDLFPPDMGDQLAALAPAPDAPAAPAEPAAPPAPPAAPAPPAEAPPAPPAAPAPPMPPAAPPEARPPWLASQTLPEGAAPPGGAPGAPGGVVIPDTARLAKANNNPGNLKFAGQPGAVPGEGGFAKFASPEAGVEALMKQVVHDGQNGMNLGAFVTKYSPPGENDTVRLIKSYSSSLGVSPDTPLTAHDASGKPIIPLDKLVALVAQTESGTQISTDQVHDAIGTPAYARPQGTQVASNDPNFVPGTPPGAPAQAPTSPYDFSKLFADNKATLENQQHRIDDYIASQPKFDAALAAARAKYTADTTPTQFDRMSDIFNQYQQGALAASGLQHATAGGVLLHALPDMTGAQQAAESAHRSDLQQRANQLARSGEQFTQAAGDIATQRTQAGANLTAQGGLAAEMIKNGLDSGRLTIEAANAGLTIAQKFEDAVHKTIPNPETYGQLAPVIAAATRDTPTDYNGNMAKLAKIVSDAQNGTLQGFEGTKMQMVAKDPSQQFMIETPSTDPNGSPNRQLVNAATVEGQNALKNAPQNARVTNLAAPQNNTPITNNIGSPGGEGGKGAQHSLADQHAQAIQTKQAAEAALSILPFLKENGGTGVLTDSTTARPILNALRQSLGYDPTGAPAREVYGKLMSQIQTANVLPQMGQLGRGTGGEFNKMLTGQIGSDYTAEAAEAFLRHMISNSDWNERRINETADAQQAARSANNNYFDPDYFRIKWQSKPGNQPPSWDTSALTAIKPTSEASPTLVGKGIGDGIGAVRRMLPGASPSAPPPPDSDAGKTARERAKALGIE